MQYNGGTMNLTFATPVQAFGGYFAGVQNFSTNTITFSDGSSQVVNFVQASGGVPLLGFTDAGKSITSITIDGANDAISMDDLRYTTIPEPASVAAIGLGLV